jgi:hypothetical protein
MKRTPLSILLILIIASCDGAGDRTSEFADPLNGVLSMEKPRG